MAKTLTSWLHETPPHPRQVGVRLSFRGCVIPVARYRNVAENRYLARLILIVLLGRNPWKNTPDDPATEFEREGGAIEYFTPLRDGAGRE